MALHKLFSALFVLLFGIEICFAGRVLTTYEEGRYGYSNNYDENYGVGVYGGGYNPKGYGYEKGRGGEDVYYEQYGKGYGGNGRRYEEAIYNYPSYGYGENRGESSKEYYSGNGSNDEKYGRTYTYPSYGSNYDKGEKSSQEYGGRVYGGGSNTNAYVISEKP